MTLEELSVVFSADIQPFTAAVDTLQGVIGQAESVADGMAGAFFQSGLAAAEGLRSGLLGGKGGVISAAVSLAEAASAALRKALQIHSPSQVTRDMGRMFDAGFLQGILDEMPRVDREARHLGDVSQSALQSSLAKDTPVSASSGVQPSPVHVTIPLELDGYRLGMAVIENLNRITASTGRVELEL